MADTVFTNPLHKGIALGNPITREEATTLIESTVKETIKGEFDHYLQDLSFRIGQAYDLIERSTGTASVTGGKVYAEDLNVKDRVYLTGYAVTNDSPTVGSIAWADLHVVFNGADTIITNGSTANKYIWWSPTVTPAVLQSSNTKPVLAVNEVLLFMNEAGKHKVMLSDTNASLPVAIANLAVDRGAIQGGAVGTTQIEDTAISAAKLGANAVIAGKINTGAINNSAAFQAGVVNSGALGGNAVVAGKVDAGAINNSAVFTNGVVGALAVGNNVLTNAHINGAIIGSSEIVAGAVVAGKLAAGAINNNNLFIANVINNAAIAGGAVEALNLKVSRHFLY